MSIDNLTELKTVKGLTLPIENIADETGQVTRNEDDTSDAECEEKVESSQTEIEEVENFESDQEDHSEIKEPPRDVRQRSFSCFDKITKETEIEEIELSLPFKDLSQGSTSYFEKINNQNENSSGLVSGSSTHNLIFDGQKTSAECLADSKDSHGSKNNNCAISHSLVDDQTKNENSGEKQIGNDIFNQCNCVAGTSKGDNAQKLLKREDKISISPAVVSTKQKHIMISYCHKQKNLAFKLLEELRKSGFTDIWIDKENVHKGIDILDDMANAVDNSCAVLCLLSNDYHKSKNCMCEIRYARNRETTFIPLIAEANFVPEADLLMCIGNRFRFDLSTDDQFSGNYHLLEEKLKSL